MPRINITLPVFNEEAQLVESVTTVHAFLLRACPVEFELVIADNGSTDGTPTLAEELALGLPQVTAAHVPHKGRGQALKKIWTRTAADILSYMDVDLSTHLDCFPPLIESLLSGQFDIAIGSRLLKDSRTTRGFKREVISRCYNRLIKAIFHTTRFSDAQCGFKALTKKAARELLPLVEDNGWFMDTELLILAEKLGYRIFDLPVRWVEDSDSRVKILSTAIADLRGLWRLRKRLRAGGIRREPAHLPCERGVCADRNHEFNMR